MQMADKMYIKDLELENLNLKMKLRRVQEMYDDLKELEVIE